MKLSVILASSSPRRKQLLELIGVSVDDYISPEVDESPLPKELPRNLALRLAKLKAATVAENYQNHIIIAADSVVACGRRILDKAETDEEVRQYLRLLSGRRSKVYTGLSVVHPNGKVSNKLVESIVCFKRLTADEIEDYVATKEGIGKAGGYAIQGIASKYISKIYGSYHAIMGLPVHEVYQILTGVGALS